MIAFQTSCARRLNGVVGRTGRVFADRYHARYLTNRAQVRERSRMSWWLAPEDTPPVAEAQFWLLTTGWRWYGATATREVPGPRS
jgi:hypothetical protein